MVRSRHLDDLGLSVMGEMTSFTTTEGLTTMGTRNTGSNAAGRFLAATIIQVFDGGTLIVKFGFMAVGGLSTTPRMRRLALAGRGEFHLGRAVHSG
ncbi:MAG: hypothetical protein P8J59_05200 [Phycisphaerales bacterium]|jgi:hypothetical protein|nr:hypothetical protein [Phycisphaerales bacterium]